MKLSKFTRLFTLLIFSFFLIGTLQAQEVKKKKKKKKKEKTENVIEADEKTAANLSLADRLRRVPGIRIMGQGSDIKVAIRGGQSSAGGTDPLFVIDRVPIGTNYAQVNSMVEVNDIKRIEVLKGADAAMYGTRGNNGVVIITTKNR